jgi:ribose-phosphate pyrophosphokinase
VVSPDAGGIKMAHAYSQTLEAELAIVAKRRKSATEVESMAVIGEIEGKNVLLVDDLTETAGTLTSAATLLKTKGAPAGDRLRLPRHPERNRHPKIAKIQY